MAARRSTVTAQTILEGFVILDHRLSQHPLIRAEVSLSDDEQRLVPVLTANNRRDLGDVLAALSVAPNGISSYAGVPLWAQSRIVGVLHLDSAESVDFSKYHDHLALLGSLLSFALLPPAARRRPSIDTERVGAAIRTARQHLGLTQETLSQRANISRIALGWAELGKSTLSLGQLWRICHALGFAAAGPSIVRVVDVSSRLMDLLKADARVLHNLSPQEFEQFVAERLNRIGFDVTLTGDTFRKDGGIDLIAVPKLRSVGSFLLAGQVKHHRSNVTSGRADVDRLLAWRGTSFNVGMLVTNTTFSADARWLAQQGTNPAFLRLRDFEDLRRWITDDFGSEYEWREIPDRIELAPGVIIEIPRPSIPNYKELWPDFCQL